LQSFVVFFSITKDILYKKKYNKRTGYPARGFSHSGVAVPGLPASQGRIFLKNNKKVKNLKFVKKQ